MPPALLLSGIDKAFGGMPALSGAEFAVAAGQVHALLGENGAGKSTLMNVAAGLYAPDAGTIRVDGAAVSLAGPADAQRLGIGMVHQHYKLVKTFSAVENILLANPRPSYRDGLASIAAQVRDLSASLGFDVDLARPVGLLSIAEQQRVEILKVLAGGARVLILDEPTAVLTDAESQRLLTTVRGLAAKGTAVVLVTHKLAEVLSHADAVTVMRAGRTVATADARNVTAQELTTLVVGAHVVEMPRPSQRIGAEVLCARGLAGARNDGYRILQDASFSVREGEIYGIAGVGGNGQTELAEIVMGVARPLGGSLALAEAGDVTGESAEERRRRGLACIPADRHAYGLAGDLPVCDNFGIAGVLAGRFGGMLRVDEGRIRRAAVDAVRAFDVQGIRSVAQKAGLLSGGNAQKLVIAREFGGSPRIVLAHSPSRGLDVRATAAVHERLRAARDGGAGVLLISEDLDEILLLCDRIGVMSRGRIVAEFDAPADRQQVGHAMVSHG